MAKTLKAKAPFSRCTVYGPYDSAGGKRQAVHIVSPSGKRTTMDYGRYRMSVKLGRRLKRGEIVDHKNNDPRDNRLWNLQIVTSSQNRIKDAPPIQMFSVPCDECGATVTRREHQSKESKGNQYTFCSRQCSGRYSRRLRGAG